MAITKISNVILLVADLERSVRFYEGILGLEVVSRSGEFAFLATGGATLALRRQAGIPPSGATEVVFEVDDIAADFAELRRRGVPFRVEPRMVTRTGTHELHAADFTDPDGHVLSITGWVSAGAS